MTSSRARLVEGPVGAHLVSMTAPMIWAVLAIMMFNATDTWFVAQLGAEPLAAMSFTFPVVMVLTSLGIGMMAGTSSVLARVVGEGDMPAVRRLAMDTLLLALLVSLGLSAAGIASLDALFTLMGASAEVLPMIRDYMLVWYAGYALVLVPMVVIGAVRATGDTRIQARLLMASAGINLALDPLLIFGLLGFPRLELQGAAIASVVARLITLGIGAWVVQRMHLLASPRTSLASLAASWRRVLHVALPAAGTNVIIPVSAGIIVALLAGFGDRSVAGYGAAVRIEALTLVVFFAMSAVIGPFVGQNLGARKHQRIGEALRLCALFCLAFGALLAVALALLAEPLSRLFSDDPEVVRVTTLYLRIVPISYGAAGIIMVVNAAFNGVGKPLPAVAISVARTLVLYVPLAWAASRVLGVPGIFAAACLSDVLSGIIAYAWFRSACRTYSTAAESPSTP
ncbi:MAG: MATE family efflux transporter [Gammaproteobacteria bacterium]|nr:MATE family efflux transporter [Gammaproteobacteria bacterium]